MRQLNGTYQLVYGTPSNMIKLLETLDIVDALAFEVPFDREQAT